MYSAVTITAKISPYVAYGKRNSLQMRRFQGEILARTFDQTPVPAEGAAPAEMTGGRKWHFPASKRGFRR